MSAFRLSVDLGPLLAKQAGIAQAMLPLVSQAVSAVAEEGSFRWKQAIQHAKLWEGEKAPYIESIAWRMVTPFEAEISTDYAKAGEIETGRPARDLKRVLQTSKKTRTVKHGPRKGQLYLIIPMRHNTPGNTAHANAMPPSVYKAAKKLEPSRLLPPGSVNAPFRLGGPKGLRALVPQHSYKWGGALPAGMVPKLKSSHKTDIYAGMYKFDTSTPGSKSSAYLTFRVMGEWSNGWIVPAKPGLYIARDVAAELQPLLEDSIGHAMQLTMKG